VHNRILGRVLGGSHHPVVRPDTRSDEGDHDKRVHEGRDQPDAQS
jgi:hypothetical protein